MFVQIPVPVTAAQQCPGFAVPITQLTVDFQGSPTVMFCFDMRPKSPKGHAQAEMDTTFAAPVARSAGRDQGQLMCGEQVVDVQTQGKELVQGVRQSDCVNVAFRVVGERDCTYKIGSLDVQPVQRLPLTSESATAIRNDNRGIDVAVCGLASCHIVAEEPVECWVTSFIICGPLSRIESQEIVHAPAPSDSPGLHQMCTTQLTDQPAAFGDIKAGQRGRGLGTDFRTGVERQQAKQLRRSRNEVLVGQVESGPDTEASVVVEFFQAVLFCGQCFSQFGHGLVGIRDEQRCGDANGERQSTAQLPQPTRGLGVSADSVVFGVGGGQCLLEQFHCVICGQDVDLEKTRPVQIGQVVAAGDQHPVLASAGQERADLLGAGGVVEDDERALPGGVAVGEQGTPQPFPIRLVSWDALVGNTERAQQARQSAGRLNTPVGKVVTTQVHHQHAARQPSCGDGVVGGAYGDRCLTYPRQAGNRRYDHGAICEVCGNRVEQFGQLGQLDVSAGEGRLCWQTRDRDRAWRSAGTPRCLGPGSHSRAPCR